MISSGLYIWGFTVLTPPFDKHISRGVNEHLSAGWHRHPTLIGIFSDKMDFQLLLKKSPKFFALSRPFLEHQTRQISKRNLLDHFSPNRSPTVKLSVLGAILSK